jgi:hypothetical protein
MAKCDLPWCRTDHRWHSRQRKTYSAKAVLVGGPRPYINVHALGIIDGPANLRDLANAILKELGEAKPKRRKRTDADG